MLRPVSTQRCRGNSCRGRSSTRQGVACDHAEPPNSLRIHCRGTHRQEWFFAHPPRRQAVIADVRHVRNGTGRYCTLRGYGQGQAHQPAASGNRDVKPGLWYSRRPHRLHHPALRPCDIPRHLQKVHVLHTGESDAGRAGSFWLPGEATAQLPEPKVHGHFTDRARRNTRIASIVVDRTTGSRMPVQYGGAQPKPLRRTRIGT